MAEFDREELKHAVRGLRPPPLRNRIAKPSVEPQLAAITKQKRQMRQETLRTVEDALAKAGVDMRKLRVAIARKHKQRQDAIAKLRPRPPAESSPPKPIAAAAASSRFRSLQPLAGRAIPLDQPPTFTFLNQPFEFRSDETGAPANEPFLKSYGLAANPTYFSTYVFSANGEDAGAEYGFWYQWNNDSDTDMLVNVSTALELLGTLFADAETGSSSSCWDAYVSSYVYGALYVGFPKNPFEESRTSFLGIAATTTDSGAGGQAGRTLLHPISSTTRTLACPLTAIS